VAWLALALGVAAPVGAEDFTFRRVGVPDSGTTDRITVQIDPSVPMFVSNRATTPFVPVAPEDIETPRGGGGAARAAGVDWFWRGVSPLRADSGPGRLDQALEVIAQAPAGEITAPRLQHMQDMARIYGNHILRETVGTRVSPALVLAVMSVESAGRADAVSHAGAAGLMQLMPATAARFGVSDRLAPGESIRGGVAYLDFLLHRFGGDPILAVAAYNAGEGGGRRQRRRAALLRDEGLRAQGAGCLDGRAGAVRHAARTRVGWLRVHGGDLVSAPTSRIPLPHGRRSGVFTVSAL
jgi:hypothetical protein